MKKYILMLFVFLIGGFVMLFSTTNAQENFGINLKGSCLTGVGEGCFDVEKLLFPDSKIDETNKRRTVKTIIQDVAFGAIYMVGTVLTIAIIYCGLMYIFAAGAGTDTTKFKDGLIDSAIGALLVRGAYAIVRLIQYMAKL